MIMLLHDNMTTGCIILSFDSFKKQ